MSLLRRFQPILPRYETFIRSHLLEDYAHAIYEQAYSSSLHEKVESFQYNAFLTNYRSN